MQRAKEREAQERLRAEVMLAGIRALSTASIADPFGALFEVLKTRLEAAEAIVLTLDVTKGRVRAATSGLRQEVEWPIEGPIARALSGQVVLIGDCSRVRALSDLVAMTDGQVRSAVCAGLHMPDMPGLLMCTHPNRNHFGRMAHQIIERLAPIAGQALVRLEARDREVELLEQTRAQNDALRAEIEERIRTEARLKDAQEKLIQSAKLSSLGRLVAGVAHEINTPLGVAMTANSIVEERIKQLHGLMTTGKLRRIDLTEHLSAALEGADMAATNLTRAAGLVRDFKEIAVDRSSEEHRVFSLKQYVGQVISSLTPLLRNRSITVEVIGDETIHLDMPPGPIAQVVTNLVQNAVTHAFDEDERGVVTFDVQRTGREIHFVYRDSGRGMTNAVTASAFEPFMTTRRGSGGSGLGLFLIHNIIKGMLNGELTLESNVGEGTTIVMTWPAELVEP
ncbi:MAG: HAMP domain-containing sensor histidine kinase [Myxococcota bacterium]|nr:HAMP domain-containing sensor histidine kinase [Myxococcota bacterium]